MAGESFIEIEGQLVRVYERTLKEEYPLHDMLPFLETRVPITSPVLPDRTVIFHYDESDPNNRKIAVACQMDAMVRTLRFGGGTKDKRLSIPYTVFIFTATTGNPDGNWAMQNRRIFWSAKPITSFKDNIIPALTPNVYEDGSVCGGGRAATTQALKDQCDKFMNEWYLIDFSEVGHNRRNAMPFGGAASFTQWVEMTEKNPRGFTEWDEFNPAKTNQPMTTIEKAMGVTIDREVPIVLPDGIPNLTFNPTFGAAEEWVGGLNETQVARLKAAIALREGGTTPQTIVAETPAPRRRTAARG